MNNFTFTELSPREETVILLKELARLLQTASSGQKARISLGN